MRAPREPSGIKEREWRESDSGRHGEAKPTGEGEDWRRRKSESKERFKTKLWDAQHSRNRNNEVQVTEGNSRRHDGAKMEKAEDVTIA